MSLREQQRVFWESVRTRPGPAALDEVFASRGALSARERMEIYRTAYWVRQVQALRELFPTLVERVGDARFAQLASRYVAARPSTSWAIELIGPPFVEWLRELAESVEEVEFAARDWARFAVFIAPEVQVVKREALRQLSLDTWVVRSGAHVHLASGVVIWREGFSVFEAPISDAEASALTAAREGVDFSTWCQLVAGDEERGPDFVLATLERWLSRGWLVTA